VHPANHVIEVTNVGMIQGGNGARFALEALFEFRIVGEMSRQDLDGHRAVEARIASAIDFAHATCTQWRLNFIRPEFRARGKSHPCAQL